MDPNVTFSEGEIARLHSDCDNMDIEVVGALNVESPSSAQDCRLCSCKAQGSEADMTILAEPGIYLYLCIFLKQSCRWYI